MQLWWTCPKYSRQNYEICVRNWTWSEGCLLWALFRITLKQNLYISMPCFNMLQCVTYLFNLKNFVLTVPCDEMLIRPCILLTSKEISIQHFSQNLLWQCKVHRYIHPHFLHFIELVDASFWDTSDLRISS